jgi:hypothetical protein
MVQAPGTRHLTEALQIPKPNEDEGLKMLWNSQSPDMDKLKALSEEIRSKI